MIEEKKLKAAAAVQSIDPAAVRGEMAESRPARARSFEEAQPEIVARLANQKRAAAVATLIAALR